MKPTNKLADDSKLKAEDYNVKFIHNNVIETLFSALPSEQTDRKKEQERRRKLKEKLTLKYPDCLIVDSSYVTSDGHNVKQYTNTLFVTESLDWWETKIVATFSGSFTQKNKDLSSRNQLILYNEDGGKFLTFTFYPSKRKIMTQGSHNELVKWIAVFRDMCPCKDDNNDAASTNNVQDTSVEVTESDAEDSVTSESDDENDVTVVNIQSEELQMEKQSEVEDLANMAACSTLSVSTSENNAADEIIQMSCSKPPTEPEDTKDPEYDQEKDSVEETGTPEGLTDCDLPADIEINEEDPADPPLNSPSAAKTSLNWQRRRVSGITLRRSSQRRDSLQAIRLKQRIDGLEGIITGLQGGVMKLIDSVQKYKEDTENVLVNQMQCITEKLQSVNARMTTIERTLSQTDVAEKVNSVNKKLADINKCGSDIHKKYGHVTHDLADIADKMNGLNEKLGDINRSGSDGHIPQALSEIKGTIDHLERKVDNCTKKTTEHLSVLKEEIVKLSEMRHQHDPKPRESGSSDESTDHRPSDTALTTHDVRPRPAVPSAMANATERPHPRETERHVPTMVNREPTSGINTQYRRILLVGDSTTKLIDKRQLLKEETISKCRAATIHDAYVKISTGGSHEMDKIIYCVGLNDLRDGKNAHQIEKDMKYLVDETIYRHPRSTVYICSILPVTGKEVDSSKIYNVNKQLRSLEGLYTNVQYIDICTEFLNHDTPWMFFEKDGIHPNTRGNMTMISIIRKKLQLQRRQSQSRTGRLANPAAMSYAECVAGNMKDISGRTHEPQKPPEMNKACHPPYPYAGYPPHFHRLPGLHVPAAGPYPQAPMGCSPWYPYVMPEMLKFGQQYPF